jgi:stage II sporulation protein D
VEALWPEVQVGYLRAQLDPYCTRAGATTWSWTARPEEIQRALGESRLQTPRSLRTIRILNRTGSGRARTLVLEGASGTLTVSASSLRFAMGRSLGWNTLRSDAYDIENVNSRIHFLGRGEGHGIGLCQRGADEMGVEGLSYRDILAFYYPGTSLGRTGTGLKWVRLGGEGFAVLTTLPDQDGNVLGLAEKLRRDWETRLRPFPSHEITIRVYSDIDSFRNATGEPGWVAARSSGTSIELQPVGALSARGVLVQTLRHEILHVLLESHAAPGLPLWFREGLVEWMAQSDTALAYQGSINEDYLRQRRDRDRARLAYEQARGRIAVLIQRYGEDAVLGWISRGLPREVANSSDNNAPTNDR